MNISWSPNRLPKHIKLVFFVVPLRSRYVHLNTHCGDVEWSRRQSQFLSTPSAASKLEAVNEPVNIQLFEFQTTVAVHLHAVMLSVN